MTDYTPIACADYSRYELAILHHTDLHLVWDGDGLLHKETVRPVDLQTRNHEEFLICLDHAGHTLHIRLDRIKAIQHS